MRSGGGASGTRDRGAPWPGKLITFEQVGKVNHMNIVKTTQIFSLSHNENGYLLRETEIHQIQPHLNIGLDLKKKKKMYDLFSKTQGLFLF